MSKEQPSIEDFLNDPRTQTFFMKIDENAEASFQLMTSHGFWLVGFDYNSMQQDVYGLFVREHLAMANLDKIVKRSVKTALKEILKDYDLTPKKKSSDPVI